MCHITVKGTMNVQLNQCILMSKTLMSKNTDNSVTSLDINKLDIKIMKI